MLRAWTEGSLGALVAYLQDQRLVAESNVLVALPGLPTVGSEEYSWCPPSSASDGMLSLTCRAQKVTTWYQRENEGEEPDLPAMDHRTPYNDLPPRSNRRVASPAAPMATLERPIGLRGSRVDSH
jgi:hypothetical protein